MFTDYYSPAICHRLMPFPSIHLLLPFIIIFRAVIAAIIHVVIDFPAMPTILRHVIFASVAFFHIRCCSFTYHADVDSMLFSVARY